MTTDRHIIDCHTHIIDPARFSFADGPGYKPRADESGAREAFCATLDAHEVGHAVLVQPSCYGFDNAAVLDAMATNPGRFKAIAVLDPRTPEAMLASLAERGVVGVRFNLVSYERDALTAPSAERFLARLKALGWFAQIYADDAQWPELAAILLRAGVKVLIDHFGVRDPSRGVAQPGFQSVLRLGRAGNATIKFTAPFRVSRQGGTFADLDPFVASLITAFGIRACIWGSDWPFINLPGGYRYSLALRALDRWVAAAADRDLVLRGNPARLFGFGE
ncbi:MAG TPA: amidohydrolase family protein [Stellaceae bacterium]|nr:amidohydrolase family protein [Stellaceae bacterium]